MDDSRGRTRRTVLRGVGAAGATLLGTGMASGETGTESLENVGAPGAPPVTWSRTYRGDGESYRLEGDGYESWGRAAVGTADGGFALGTDGRTITNGQPSEQSFFALVKADAAGRQQWAQGYDDGRDGTQMNLRGMASVDGGFVLVGGSRAANRQAEPFDGAAAAGVVVRAAADGTKQWSHVFTETDTGTGPEEDPDRERNAYFTCAAGTSDGGCVVGGKKSSRGWLLKLDAAGNRQWERLYLARPDRPTYDEAVSQVRDVVQTVDGGYAVALAGGRVIRAESDGAVRWSTHVRTERLDAVVQTHNGGVAVAGDDGDFLLARVAQGGALQWTATYDGPARSRDLAHSLVQTPDGGFVLAGTMAGDGDTGRLAFLKTGPTGAAQWHRLVGRTSGYAHGQSLVPTSDGGLVASWNGPGLVKLGGSADPTTTTQPADTTTQTSGTTDGTTRATRTTGTSTTTGATGTTRTTTAGTTSAGTTTQASDGTTDGTTTTSGFTPPEEDEGPIESFFEGIIDFLEDFL